MANTTFSGPIRSETTVKTISKNSSTGAITEIITDIKLEDAEIAHRQNTAEGVAPQVSVAT